ncbi:hypothetical protein [Aeromicrobium massiliense]|uniref:hypothetical protein n=1 Tax=Aeromicrobium massiliense TaxID=1464554 RepID=UPI00031AAFF4|nr:hypothetical protein [Aeromicrobium massiliense]
MRWRRRDQEPTLDDKLWHVEARLHVMEGLLRALTERAAVLDALDAASSMDDAIVRLGERLGIDEVQATAVTDMQLRRLVPAEIVRIEQEVRFCREQRDRYLRQGAKPR